MIDIYETGRKVHCCGDDSADIELLIPNPVDFRIVRPQADTGGLEDEFHTGFRSPNRRHPSYDVSTSGEGDSTCAEHIAYRAT